LFWIIKNGSQGTGMMAYKAMEDNQIWQLILHIRHLANITAQLVWDFVALSLGREDGGLLRVAQ